jgi:5'-phosphate synthase pdxT subunit
LTSSYAIICYMRIAVLALQGAFAEHRQKLAQLGVDSFEVRQLKDWDQPKDGLIIPGGESTTQAKLLNELGLMEPVKEAIAAGLPVYGTCAGLILLAKKIEGEPSLRIASMDITALRNAYGRQLGSFYIEAPMKGIEGNIPMTFIRAPYIKEVWGDAEVLAEVDGKIVAARQGKQLVTAFHPELNESLEIHKYFLDMCKKQASSHNETGFVAQ